MAAGSFWGRALPERKELNHVMLVTVATVASLLIARMFRLPEFYWAPITTIVVMQSTLGAAWTISRQRLVGTAIGAVMGALMATYSQSVVVFAIGFFISGLICAMLRLERNAFRYTGITVAIIFLISHTERVWVVAVHRFVEIAMGIAVGLVLTAIFPEKDPAAA